MIRADPLGWDLQPPYDVETPQHRHLVGLGRNVGQHKKRNEVVPQFKPEPLEAALAGWRH